MSNSIKLKQFAILSACVFYDTCKITCQPDQWDTYEYTIERNVVDNTEHLTVTCVNGSTHSTLTWMKTPRIEGKMNYQLLSHEYSNLFDSIDNNDLYLNVVFHDVGSGNGSHDSVDGYKSLNGKHVSDIAVLVETDKDDRVHSLLNEFETLIKKWEQDANIASIKYADGVSNVIDEINFDACGIYIFPEPAAALKYIEQDDADAYDFTVALLQANPWARLSPNMVNQKTKMVRVCFCSYSLTYKDWRFDELGHKLYGVGTDRDNLSWFKFPTYLPLDMVRQFSEGTPVKLVLPIRPTYGKIGFPPTDTGFKLIDRYYPDYRFNINLTVTPMQLLSPYDRFGDIEHMFNCVR